MKTLTTLLLTILAFEFQAQSFSKEQTLADLHFLANQIEEYNPALPKYVPGFREKADSLIQTVSKDQNLFEYFTKVSKLCALSNEGHFQLGDWEDTVHRGFLNNSYLNFPISVEIIGSQMFVWNDYSDENQLERGWEIISINGRSSQKIIEQVFSCMPTDGHIKTYPRQRLEENFNWLYYFYVEQAESFDLVVKHSQQPTTKTYTIKALTRDDLFANLEERKPEEERRVELKGKDQVYDFEIKQASAFLIFRTFHRGTVERNKIKARKLYKEIFKELREKNIEHLTIDLQDNAGGRKEFALEIIPYLLKEKQKGYAQVSLSWKGKEKTYKLPRPSKYAFEGEIYVLVNGGTFSNGSVLTRYLREYGGAEIIGEETGTRYEGFAAGSIQSVTLPHSGIRIGIPRYALIFPESKLQTTSNRGLIPDHAVHYSLEDLMEGKDKHLEKLDELLVDKKAMK